MRTLFFSACALGLATAANAQPPVTVSAPAVQVERVSFADLNLGSERGMSAIKSRIRAAAYRVCNLGHSRVDPLATQLEGKACFRTAVSDGYSQLDQIALARANGATIATATLTIRGR